ncbi:hypothetical protein ALP8811_01055 [Aliiroseovarius pelagivivens]|uniref:Sulfotransferase family protein n=1 Tax=Aliiroseovarius pelagivivens TaxID=1639690 RepID=A0A2R8AJ40_9RHOB|nr:sulfotransferase family protein [Aliiroseovarius pelagivivens]SPF76056.1 hypothetical protein ALP8811_01055 [Aliiroseovarius pelagivivens]
MSLKVIGTGFGRTGTDSMREALNILGFGPTHHMFELNDNPHQTEIWRTLVEGGLPDWDQLFEGYHACVDWPSAHYWRDLIDHYPDAKVILTQRPSDAWWRSFEKTILSFTNSPDDPDKFFSQKLVGDTVFGGRPVTRDHAISIYEAHIQDVKDTVPEHRLLVHGLGDGWAPLCRHLEVEIPQQDYPNRNAKKSFQDRVEAQRSS